MSWANGSPLPLAKSCSYAYVVMFFISFCRLNVGNECMHSKKKARTLSVSKLVVTDTCH